MVAQDYSYSVVKLDWLVIFKRISELGNEIGLGRGWLRAVAQVYSYSYNDKSS